MQRFIYLMLIMCITAINAHQNTSIAYIQTDKGLQETESSSIQKRSLSTDFKSDSTYVTPNGLTCFVCQPGFFKRSDCTQNMTTAACQQCPTGQYSSTYNIANYCANCLPHCMDNNAEVFQQCTPTTNMVCRCKSGYYNHSKGAGEWICLPHKLCEPGTEVYAQGTFERDTECRPCPQGTFSTNESTRNCSKCSSCTSDQHTKSQCNPKKDTICESKDDDLPLKVGLPLTVLVVVMVAIVIIVMLWRKGILTKCKSRLFSTSKDVDEDDKIACSTDIALNMNPDNVNNNEIIEDNLPRASQWLKVFKEIAQKINIKEWKHFFRTLLSKKLELTAANRKIDEICYNYRHDNVDEKIYQCFIAWQKLSDEMVLGDITSALEEHQMLNLSAILQKRFPTLMKDATISETEELNLREQD